MSLTKTVILGLLLFLFIILPLFSFYFLWFHCRIEVAEGEFVPLLKKSGKVLENSQVIAPSSDYRGPQLDILKEGRHFRNPYNWWWPSSMKATIIPNQQVGVVVRKFGKPLLPGAVVTSSDDERGILPEPRGPGRYYFNQWAYLVELHPMVKIEPGFMGVVTLLVGEKPKDSNVFVVKKGERGTQPFLLQPGTHPQYSNPYVHLVTPIDVRSHKFEMSDQYGIVFPSKYGFDIRVEGTIEWAPDVKKLPELFVKYVDEEDLKASGGINNIQRKIILTFARSYFRTVGGQHRAVDYITGDTRIKVQQEVERRLRDSCAAEGIEIRSFVIRATEPPKAIREQYERRELARRQTDRFQKEIETEIGTFTKDGKGKEKRDGGRLAKVILERKKNRESLLGGIRVKIAQELRSAEQYSKVEMTKARRKLAVAEVGLESAKDRAAQIMAKGKAEAAVTVMQHQAEVEAVRAKVAAFGSGPAFAENQLIKKLSPGIRKILSNTDGPFAKLFERFTVTGDQKKGKGVNGQ